MISPITVFPQTIGQSINGMQGQAVVTIAAPTPYFAGDTLQNGDLLIALVSSNGGIGAFSAAGWNLLWSVNNPGTNGQFQYANKNLYSYILWRRYAGEANYTFSFVPSAVDCGVTIIAYRYAADPIMGTSTLRNSWTETTLLSGLAVDKNESNLLLVAWHGRGEYAVSGPFVGGAIRLSDWQSINGTSYHKVYPYNRIVKAGNHGGFTFSHNYPGIANLAAVIIPPTAKANLYFWDDFQNDSLGGIPAGYILSVGSPPGDVPTSLQAGNWFRENDKAVVFGATANTGLVYQGIHKTGYSTQNIRFMQNSYSYDWADGNQRAVGAANLRYEDNNNRIVPYIHRPNSQVRVEDTQSGSTVQTTAGTAIYSVNRIVYLSEYHLEGSEIRARWFDAGGALLYQLSKTGLNRIAAGSLGSLFYSDSNNRRYEAFGNLRGYDPASISLGGSSGFRARPGQHGKIGRNLRGIKDHDARRKV